MNPGYPPTPYLHPCDEIDPRTAQAPLSLGGVHVATVVLSKTRQSSPGTSCLATTDETSVLVWPTGYYGRLHAVNVWVPTPQLGMVERIELTIPRTLLLDTLGRQP